MPGRRPSRWFLAGFIALLLNAAYLWACAEPTSWYVVQVAAHPSRGWRGGYGGVPALQANQTVTIEEGSGVVRKAPIGAKR